MEPRTNREYRSVTAGTTSRSHRLNHYPENSTDGNDSAGSVIEFRQTKGGLSSRRIAHSRLMHETQEKKLFEVLAERYSDRNGGYTRIIKAGYRDSDAAAMAVIELVDRDQ